MTTTADCTVTTPEGVLIATCPGGVQTLFVAPTIEMLVSEDGAVVTASFSGASVGSAAGGGVSEKKIGEMIASSEGNVNVLYDSVTQSPPEGNLDNYNAYGWAMVVTQSGRLDTVVLQPRSQGTVLDTFPVYLNIFALEGNAWKLLGCSENGVEQSLDTPSVWAFSGVELVAGQKLHVEGSRRKGSEARDARLSARVVANTLADTGMIDRDGTVRVVDWVPKYTLAFSRPVGLVARGVALAEEADLATHVRDAVRHITADERESWNAKASTSALAGKVNTATFNAHAGNTVKHVTAAERAQWNELAGGGVTRAEMEAYVADYLAAHAPALDLSDYRGRSICGMRRATRSCEPVLIAKTACPISISVRTACG